MINESKHSVFDTQVGTVHSIRNVQERFTNNTKSENRDMMRDPAGSEKTRVCHNNYMPNHARTA